MIAMSKEVTMSHSFGKRQRFGAELCGPYACDEIDDTRLACYLEIGDRRVAIDVPADLVRPCRVGVQGGIFLRLPDQRAARVEPTRLLSDAEQKVAKAWSAEMADFDRF